MSADDAMPAAKPTPADLEAVARRWSGALLRTAHRITGDPQGAEDAVQDALTQALAALDGFRGASSLTTWLFRIAVYSATRWASRHRRAQPADAEPDELAAREPTPIDSLSAAEQAQRLLSAMQRLPLPQRLVVSLAAVEGLDRAQIADVLGIPVGTVDSRLHHGRARLREILGLREEGA